VHRDRERRRRWKSWHSPQGQLLFKSWVTYEQKLLEPLQGNDGIWFCGMHTYDVDCHESAVLSAGRIARHLSPRSERLRRLMS